MTLRVSVKNLRFVGCNMIGDLSYVPYQIFIDDYFFGNGDEVVIEDKYAYIEMTVQQLFNIAYEL